jgi:hypothetical protein
MKEGRGFAFLLNMKKIAPWKKWCLPLIPFVWLRYIFCAPIICSKMTYNCQ